LSLGDELREYVGGTGVLKEKVRGSTDESICLCVDLDGTLVRTDLLLESCLALIKNKPLLIFAIPKWLLKGKAYLKEQIAKRVKLDVSLLPYNSEFLDYLKHEHASGRELILATATHKLLADKIAAHLGIFSRCFATENGKNLSGARKRKKIISELGEGNFDYAANDHVDLAVWSHSRKIILVNPDRSLESKARDVAEVAKTFKGNELSPMQYINALRPHQWAKNLLVLIPYLAAHSVINTEVLTSIFLALVSFSLCASGAYVVNDMLDVEADRSHPKKRNRPFASGALPLSHGMLMVPVLFFASFALAALLPIWFSIILAGYLLTTFAYTMDLKERIIVDVLVLAILYTYRLLAGSAATGIWPSTWLLGFSMFLFLSLALVKRYSELHSIAGPEDQKTKGRGYKRSDLPLVLSLGTSSGYLAVLVLALYISSADILLRYASPELLWGLCILLLYWISRTWMLTSRGKMNHDPVVFALTDRISQAVGMICALNIAAAAFINF
jgi:4-hydroxybenzoate polyprenyltransferase